MAVAAPSNVLYVGNLPKGTSKSSLEGFLQPYGVMRLNVREGYGIAEMNSVAEATRAIQQLNGYDFNGSSIAVRFKSQTQHKSGGQFRQVNNNHHNSKVGFQDGPGKDKNFTPASPPVLHQEPMFGNDLSSPQSSMPAEVRTVQVGLRGLQITTTNNLAQHQKTQQGQLEQELKNVAFLPDSEKVRHLEQLVHLQQSKINKLEAKLEEVMEANKQAVMQNGHPPNRPNVMMPAGSVQMQMQNPLAQQQAPGLANFNNQNLQFSYYNAQQHWQAAYPAANSYYCDQQQVQPGYVPPPLMLQTSKLGHSNGYGVCDSTTAAYLPSAAYAQNMVRVGGDVLSPMPCDAMNNCFFPSGQVAMPPPSGDFHQLPRDGRVSNVENRYNRNARTNNIDTHRGGFGSSNNSNSNNNHSNRSLRNGNRQNGFAKSENAQQRSIANKANADAEKNKTATVKSTNVEKEPPSNPTETRDPSPKPVEAVCPRCQKSIPENAAKCPDCRSSSGTPEDDECEKELSTEEKSPEKVEEVAEEAVVSEATPQEESSDRQ